MSSSVQVDNEKKDTLVLGKGPTQGLGHTLTAEKMYSISFTLTRKRFCLSLVICLLMVQKFINSKQKILRLLQLHHV